MSLFCRYLLKFIKEEFPDERVGFMDPSRTNAIMINDNRGRVLQYMGKALQENRDKRLIFIPYHHMLVLYIYSNFIIIQFI
jgi:hypothetical protein